MGRIITLMQALTVLFQYTTSFHRYSDVVNITGPQMLTPAPQTEQLMNQDEIRITDIEPDRYDNDIIYCTVPRALLKLRISSGEFKLLAGKVDSLVKDFPNGKVYNPDPLAFEARFSQVTSVTQINSTMLVITDYGNYCYRTYSLLTKTVTQLIGNCSKTSNALSNQVENGLFYDADAVPLNLIEKIHYSSIQNIYYFRDERPYILQYDPTAGKVSLFLELSGSKTVLSTVRSFLFNKNQTLMFVSHSGGLSSINLSTKEITATIGDYRESGERKSSSNIVNSSTIIWLRNLRWIVPDVLLAGHSEHGQALSIVDLKNKQFNNFCIGDKDTGDLKLGSLNRCELFGTGGLAILPNRKELILVSRYNTEPYRNFLLHMALNVSECWLPNTTGGVEIISPEKRSYDIYTLLYVSCPIGYGIRQPYDAVTCIYSAEARGVMWNREFPTCTSNLTIVSVKPQSGQQAGGTIVTAIGIIPSEGIKINIVKQNDTKAIANHKRENNELRFEMPASSDLRPMRVKVVFLKNDSTVSYMKTFEYQYLANPQLINSSLINIRSGGVLAYFHIANQASSENYTIRPSFNSKTCSIHKNGMVSCQLPSFQGFHLRVAEGLNSSEDQRVSIYSDGILIKGNLIVTMLPDPEFIENADLMEAEDYGTITLKGEGLDLGPINNQYKVTLHSSTDSSGVVSICKVMVDEITDSELLCAINGVPSYGVQYTIQVMIGNLTAEPGKVIIYEHRDSISEASETNLVEIVVPAISSVVVIALIVISIILYYRRRKRASIEALCESYFIDLQDENGVSMMRIDEDLIAKLDGFIISDDQLTLIDKEPIGKGHFGVIYLGEFTVEDVVTTVAVKTIKELQVTKDMVEKFLEEAVFLRDFHHVNILNTLGVCWPYGETPQVVLPYMAMGDLKSLIKRDDLIFTLGDLLCFGMQIACGMSYLASHRFVHRDLAARNCLVSDDYLVKISDFGLSKDVYNKDYYKPTEESGVPLPVKWMSIESLKTGVFSTQSDVWAFGVLLWELCTRGSEPYADVNAWEIKSYLSLGHRLPRPERVPFIIYEKMSSCWLEDPDSRPTFEQLYDYLSHLLLNASSNTQDTISDYGYSRVLTNNVPLQSSEHTYYNVAFTNADTEG